MGIIYLNNELERIESELVRIEGVRNSLIRNRLYILHNINIYKYDIGVESLKDNKYSEALEYFKMSVNRYIEYNFDTYEFDDIPNARELQILKKIKIEDILLVGKVKETFLEIQELCDKVLCQERYDIIEDIPEFPENY